LNIEYVNQISRKENKEEMKKKRATSESLKGKFNVDSRLNTKYRMLLHQKERLRRSMCPEGWRAEAANRERHSSRRMGQNIG
jgi:hypothetical protein